MSAETNRAVAVFLAWQPDTYRHLASQCSVLSWDLRPSRSQAQQRTIAAHHAQSLNTLLTIAQKTQSADCTHCLSLSCSIWGVLKPTFQHRLLRSTTSSSCHRQISMRLNRIKQHVLEPTSYAKHLRAKEPIYQSRAGLLILTVALRLAEVPSLITCNTDTATMEWSSKRYFNDTTGTQINLLYWRR